MAVLYRKYRPQTFSDVLNQKPIIQTLKNQVAAGSVAHAYLFTGSRGVGKTSVARILAKAVNCLASGQRISESANQQVGDACGVCENCKAIAAGTFLDLVEVDAASNTGVDNIRELIEHVKFSPTSGKYKVFIIDEVHMLSKGAFNALLKTLEEPPQHAIFILATTEINKVPATIISRTQRFDFKAYSPENLLELLQKVSGAEEISLSLEVLELVSQTAEGSARDALSLLGKIMTLGNNASLADCQQLLGVTDLKVCEDLLEMIALGQAAELPDFFSRLAEKGLDYVIFNRDFLEFLRKVLIYKVSEGKINSNIDSQHAARIQELAEKFSTADLIFIIRLFLKAYKDLSGSPSQEIPLLLAAIEAGLRKAEAGKPASQLISKSANQQTSRPGVQNSGIENLMPIVESTPVLIHQATESPEELGPEGQIIALEQLESLWPKVIAKIKEVNGPLASMLKNSKIDSVNGGKVIIAVKFAFDKQSLENAKNTALICGCLEQVSGKRMGVIAKVIKLDIKEVGSTAEVLSDALKVFGGELIE